MLHIVGYTLCIMYNISYIIHDMLLIHGIYSTLHIICKQVCIIHKICILEYAPYNMTFNI